MSSLIDQTPYTTLHQISQVVNNDNLDEDIIVFEPQMKISVDEIIPFRIEALMIVLCTQGNCKIGIDLKEYEIRKNTLIVIQPKNYVYLSDFTNDFKCSAIACSNRVVEDVLPKLTDLLPLLMHHRTEPVSYLNETDATSIVNFHEFLRKKISGRKTPFLRQKVLCMLQAALYEMMDINLQNQTEIETQRTRKEEIMAKFILSVSVNFREERQVAFYARKLFITPKHLSSVVKEISGRTASEWIENYVIMEAKVLLKTTDMTIQEIAGHMNFANQSFFGKYFKNQTGMSPSTYRKKHSAR